MKFYGQFNPQLDQYLYENFFTNHYNGTSIEAGASNGVLENNTKFFEETMNWRTINVEPLPSWYSELVVNRPNSVNINKALHPTIDDGEVIFSIPDIDIYGLKNHLGSLNRINIEKYNYPITDIKVNTITYNKIITDNDIKSLDLFILDIEGYEVEFLKSFNEWKIYPSVFVIEIGHLKMHDQITDIIKDKYTLHSQLFVNNIYVKK